MFIYTKILHKRLILQMISLISKEIEEKIPL